MRPIGFYCNKVVRSQYVNWIAYFYSNSNRDSFLITDGIDVSNIGVNIPIVNSNEVSRKMNYLAIVPFFKNEVSIIDVINPFMLIGFEEFSETRFNYYKYLEKEIGDKIKRFDVFFDYTVNIYDIDTICKSIEIEEKRLEKKK